MGMASRPVKGRLFPPLPVGLTPAELSGELGEVEPELCSPRVSPLPPLLSGVVCVGGVRYTAAVGGAPAAVDELSSLAATTEALETAAAAPAKASTADTVRTDASDLVKIPFLIGLMNHAAKLVPRVHAVAPFSQPTAVNGGRRPRAGPLAVARLLSVERPRR
jgi:hypothetical protein